MHRVETQDLFDQTLQALNAGQVARALAKARQALAAIDEDAPAHRAEARVRFAEVLFRLGHPAEAADSARQALQETAPESSAAATAWMLLGMCAAETRQWDDVESFTRRAIVIARENDYPHIHTRALHNLAGGLYLPRGQFQLALAADQEALRLARLHGLNELVWLPLSSIAWTHILSDRIPQARQAQAELRAAAAPGTLGEGYYLVYQADLALMEGQADEAEDWLQRARSVAESVANPSLEILVRLGRSRLSALRGDHAGALHWADDAATLARRVEYDHMLGRALLEKGRARLAQGQPTAAIELWNMALALFEPLQAFYDQALAWLLLASLEGKPGPACAEALRRIQNGGYTCLLDSHRAIVFPLLAEGLSSRQVHISTPAAALLAELQRIPPAPLRARVFGGLRVWAGGRELPARGLRQRRAGELFALLLTAPGQRLTQEEACEALSPEKDTASAQNVFFHATSTLRRLLEPDLPDRRFPSRYLEIEDGQVTLRLPPDSSADLWEFEAAFRAANWPVILELYREPFLPEYPYSDWTIAIREACFEKHLKALNQQAIALLKAGAASPALELARQAIRLDAWQEQAVLTGMQACLALKDTSGALKLYQALETALQRDLGIAPQAELQALRASIGRPA